MKITIDTIESEIIHSITNSAYKVSPHCIKNHLSAHLKVTKRSVSLAINRLLDRGILEYMYVFGSSYIQLSRNRASKVSDRISLSPGHLTTEIVSGEIVILLNRGAAFGYGGHPTTRLALRMLDFVLVPPFLESIPLCSALDIGTGSGVLAIAMAMLGGLTIQALDIDPCALDEARKNVALNKLDHLIYISNQSIDHLGGNFAIIVANLRYPSIIGLLPHILRLLTVGGYFVVSGVRGFEAKNVLDYFKSSTSFFRCIRREDEKGWASLLLHRRHIDQEEI